MAELTDAQINILKSWSEVLQDDDEIIQNIRDRYDSARRLESKLRDFISDGSYERFEEFAHEVYAIKMSVGIGDREIYESNGTDELSRVLRDILSAEDYDSDWINQLDNVGERAVGEIFGSVNINEYPVDSTELKEGLEFFDYDTAKYSDRVRSFSSFKEEYLNVREKGVKSGEIPDNVEILELFDQLSGVDQEELEEASGTRKTFYQKIVEEKSSGSGNEISINPKDITKAWDRFRSNDFQYMGHDDEQFELGEANKQREENIPKRRDILRQFLEEESDVGSLRSDMASEAGSQNLWGYSGFSGGMFLNMLISAADNIDDLDLSDVLREVFKSPDSKKEAKAKIEKLKHVAERVNSEVDNSDKKVQPGFIPYFVSYFWQLQDPNKYPIYYSSIREGMNDLDIWRKEGDLAEDYVRFWETNEEIKDILEEYTGDEVHLWEIERLFQFWINRDKIEPNNEGYFWITANPDMWKASDLNPGDEKFYTAHSSEGNKRKIRSAFEKTQPGDKILFYESSPVKKVVAKGSISKGLHENEEGEEGVVLKCEETVNGPSWGELKTRSELEDSQPIKHQAQGSIFELSQKEYYNIFEPGVDPEKERLRSLIDFEEVTVDIPDELYFTDKDRIKRQIEATLNSGKNIIFTGPPGTGKTKLAKHVASECRKLKDVDDFIFTTATADWTAFDTIGGYTPSKDGSDELVFQPRIFLKCFREKGKLTNNWLVVDEINRSDIDKAFGQLFSVLSGDSVELPYEREETVEIRWVQNEDDINHVTGNPDSFPVTPSWRLIATMNTYDKSSLYEMSYAFMRRYNFIHIGVPELKTEDGDVRTSLLDPDEKHNYAFVWSKDDVLSDVYTDLSVIWSRVNEYRKIGPSIILDIAEYVDAYGYQDPDLKEEALTTGIVSLVFPQMEGMRPGDQKKMIQSLGKQADTEEGSKTPAVDVDLLKTKAEDFFEIEFEDE